MQKIRVLQDAIDTYSRRRQHPLKLDDLVEFGRNPTDEKLLKSAFFMHEELQIRLAQMIHELEILPFGLADTESVKRIHSLYVRSFAEIFDLPKPTTNDDAEKFTLLINDIKDRHNHVIETMARGIHELKKTSGVDHIGDEVRLFLDKFYMSRIGIRMLIGQHISLRQPQKGWVGIINPQTSPYEIGQAVARQASILCSQNLGIAPKIEFDGKLDLKFTYVPSHLEHMLMELVKNSLRATVEVHHLKSEKNLPPVKIIFAEGDEDVTVKIEDQGGGIPRSGMERCWTYLYTTAPPPIENTNPYFDDVQPIAGFGFGLPITRLYARYFGGDLTLMPMEGYGTDAYLHLNVLGDHEEVLPV